METPQNHSGSQSLAPGEPRPDLTWSLASQGVGLPGSAYHDISATQGPLPLSGPPLCRSHPQKAVCHPTRSLVGPVSAEPGRSTLLSVTCGSPGVRDGRPWPVYHLLDQLELRSAPTSHTHPPRAWTSTHPGHCRGPPGTLTRYQAIQVSLRNCRFGVWGSGAHPSAGSPA